MDWPALPLPQAEGHPNQNIGAEIGSIRPDDGSTFGTHLSKERGVSSNGIENAPGEKM